MKVENVEDVYQLSPLQKGLLFHTLYAPATGVYVEQVSGELHGDLNRTAFERAWQTVIDRHPVLRTSFHWEDLDEPLQVAHQRVSLALDERDWRGLAVPEQSERLAALLAAERQRGLDLSTAPLMRFSLIRLDDNVHGFAWSYHHLLLDGWARSLVLGDLFTCYESFCQDRDWHPGRIPPYRDYIAWLQQQDATKAEAAWRRTLQGFTAPTPLRVDQRLERPGEPETFIAEQRTQLSEADTAALHALSRRNQLTLNTLVQGAWAMILSRYSGEDDVVFGNVVSGRPPALPRVESMVGLFINTLPVRVRVSPQVSALAWLRDFQAQQVEMRQYEYSPLAQIQEWSDVPRHLPLFESILAFENYPANLAAQPASNSLAIQKLHFVARTNYPLNVMIVPGQALSIRISYDRRRFRDETIARMLGHFQTALIEVAADPERKLVDVPLLPEAERRQLLSTWNETQRDYPADVCFHQLFEARTKQAPDAIALVFEERDLTQYVTYGELNRRANQLAHHLQALGVGPDTAVGLFVDRSLAMIVGLLGILKAGGAYLPIDPAYPQERLAFVLHDAQAPVVLTQQSLVDRLPEHSARVIRLDADWPAIAQPPTSNLQPPISSYNLAYVIYTSGSTGAPKGVAVEHRQLVNYLFGILERLELPSGSTYATVSTLAADLGNTVIFPALYTGGCLHVISRERVFNPQALADYFTRHPIDCLKIVPSHLAALHATARPGEIMPCRKLVLGGEASDAEWVAGLQRLAPDCVILNHYGPTETTIGVLTYRANERAEASPMLPIGRPLANTHIYILDRYLRPSPIGVPGELYIGGAGLARGYLNRPDLTAEKFTPPPPFSPPSSTEGDIGGGGRLYKTGDLACYLPNGDVVFLGRADDQVKVRGYRIELKEIEAALQQHPDVREAAVLAQAREEGAFPGDRQLAAYVVPQPARAPALGGRPRYTLPNNLAVAHLNKNETDYLYQEIFVSQAYLRHGITLREGDCIFDVGANIGLFGLFAKEACRRPKLYAFEPNPIVFDILRANTTLGDGEVKCFNCGLSHQAGQARFTFFPGFSLLSGLYADAATEKEVIKAYLANQQKQGLAGAAEFLDHADGILAERFAAQAFDVPLTTLSHVIAEENIDRIDLLKINVEKSEWDVLRGIANQDWEKIKQIVLEVDVQENLEPIVALLERRGYECVVAQDKALENTTLYYVYAIRPSPDRKLIREQSSGAHLLALPIHTEPILTGGALRQFLSRTLPDYMLPATFVFLEALPLTPNGKVDRQALLAAPGMRSAPGAPGISPQTELERAIAAVWQEVLHVDGVGLHDNFFDLGGHSLLLLQVRGKLQATLKRDLSSVDLFRYPTIGALAKHLSDDGRKPSSPAHRRSLAKPTSLEETDIAIIGMAGRFPQARTLEAFWQNLRDGVEAITFFSDEDLRAAGTDPGALVDPAYVKANAVLDDVEWFDAHFFGYSPREAEIMDPQHRLFLECAWEALENAGYDAGRFAGPIGVYAGVSANTYLLINLYSNPDIVRSIGGFQTLIANDKDYLATRISYKLNLRGPSFSVQTACSTSLVAVHLARESLLRRKCDIALAGGVSIGVPQTRGYWYQADGIFSPDGRCRAFDAQAQGTLSGNGAGIVVLKRLQDALADGDTIQAVIKGSAINNDGSLKVGYTAPSVDGQAAVIAEALAEANIDPETIGYIEAHGTGTALGDPIEVAALSQVFREYTDKRGFCALGSVKTNIGHLDAAAGVAGLIKAVLALRERQIPPSLHFEQPNPHIDFAASPFFVNPTLRDWESSDTPRRAGVSSFGIGGTNAHVVLEEAPAIEASGEARDWHVLALSAKTSSALEAAADRLAQHLRSHPDLNLADVAYTLQVGRKVFSHRRVVICCDAADAIEALETREPKRILAHVQQPGTRSIAFMFPGGGAQYVHMGLGLYQAEPIFRREVARCAELLKPHLGCDVRDALYPQSERADEATRQLRQVELALPALFTVEYALAQLWLAWGVRPQALIGHSLGEYVAACLAGVFSLEDALALVATRGRLMQGLPGGAMLSLSLSEEEVRPWLDRDLSLAAVNGPKLCVVTGSSERIAALEADLRANGLDAQRVPIDVAAHSPVVEPILAEFTRFVAGIQRHPPRIPFISNVTGTWITAEDAIDPAYWGRHLRQTVRFGDGLAELLADPARVLLEVGPGHTLSRLARLRIGVQREGAALASLRHPHDEQSDVAFLLTALGRLWLVGVEVDWAAFHAKERRQRVPLPTYPFERRRYWIDPRPLSGGDALANLLRADGQDGASNQSRQWLIVEDESGFKIRRVDRMEPEGRDIARVWMSEETSLIETPQRDVTIGDDTGIAALHTRPSVPTAYAAPRNEIERHVALAWQSLLGIAQVGIDDNFFEMGGHSLLATQVMSRIRQAFQVELPLRAIFEAPTVAELAHRIAVTQSAGLGKLAPPIVPVPRDGHPPLSFAQERLWFLSQLAPDSPAYNIPAALYLRGRLDIAALERSLNELARRHETLRTTFAAVAGRPVQIIAPASRWSLPIVNLRELTPDEQEAEAHRLARIESRRTFDLARGPLLRLTLLQLSEEEHALLLTMHHLVSDGWSMGVLQRELMMLYDTYSAGEPSPLHDLPVQYADFVAWQQMWLQGEVLASQLAYWTQRLADAPGVLDLPVDRLRPAVQSFRGATQRSMLPASLATALNALSRQEGVTLFMTLLAAFDVLLHRYTGQADMVVGTPIANRNRSEVEGLIGFFVNTLVLRTDLSGDPSFRELLQRVQETALGAYTHQDLPFEKLVEALQPARTLNRTPLFQVLFVLQNAPAAAFESTRLDLSVLPIESGTAKFDLTLTIFEGAQGLTTFVEYNTDLFEPATIARLLAHYQTLLEGIVARLDDRLSELPLLTEAEQRQMSAWNETHHPYQAACVHEVFEAQAAQTRDAVAIVFEAEAGDAPAQYLTYGELNRRANQLAHRLKVLGVGPDVIAGLCIERSPEMMIGMLGILKAGGGYLPLDPESPSERLAFMLDDAHVPVVLTRTRLAQRLPASTPHVLYLDRDWAGLAEMGGANPRSGVAPENIVYVIYTSGSTGRPKGVVVEHRQILNYTRALFERLAIAPGGSFGLLQPLSVDSCKTVVFPALLSGGCLHLISEGCSLDPKALGDYFDRHPIDCLKIAPSHLAALHASLPQNPIMPRRWLVVGGEASQWDWLAKLQTQTPDCAVFNHYGPTETTVGVLTYPMKDAGGDRRSILTPLGRPLSNVQAYVLDRHLRPAPIGVPGELYIGGECVTRGYLNRPDLTAEKFIPDPFIDNRSLLTDQLAVNSEQSPVGGRIYKTGDLARYRPDGNIEFLGRSDFQVKVRGYRIETGEIEAALAEHPAVRETVVVARDDHDRGAYLVAYIVPVTRPEPSADELRRRLQAKLPDYMLPSAFVMLEALPRLPQGKVNRKALPAPDRLESTGAIAPPRNPIEEVLASIWMNVLRLQRLDLHANFFEAGGHSLLATQVMSRVREVFQLDLPLRAIFEAPTVTRLAERIEQARHAGTKTATTPITPIARGGDLPLSFAQQRLWFLHQLDPQAAIYNIASALRLSGRLDIAVLQKCLNEIVRRHETLRTTFAFRAGLPVQIIAPAEDWTLPLIDLQDLPAGEREVEARRLAQAEAARPFDLERGPLLRSMLVRLSEREHAALLTMHHIISDGWSTGVLIRELTMLYTAFAAGQSTPLPTPKVQYADFAVWQQQALKEELSAQLAYWKKQLAGAPALNLPTQHPRPAVQTFNGATRTRHMPAALNEALLALSRREGVTLFMTLLAAFDVVLHRYTGQNDIVVGTPIANRNRPEIENLVGFFANTLVLRSDLSGDPAFRSLLARVREVALDAYAHQDLPFEKVVEELQPARELDRSPLFQVMFVLQNAPAEALELPGLSLQPLAVGSGAAPFDLTLLVYEGAHGLTAALEYNTDLFERDAIDRMLEHYQTLLEGVAAHPDWRLSDLPLLTEVERRQVLVDWNNTRADDLLSWPGRVLHGFEEKVERAPDAVAAALIETDDRSPQQVTYGALNRRANRLAHYLQSAGVGPEVCVGLCVERSIEMITGVLAVLKAGGAFVPLDPEYPLERMTFILNEVQPRAILTQAQFVDRLPQGSWYIVRLDSAIPVHGAEADRNPIGDAWADQLAYVIYTSGSTGIPKGVLISHAALARHCRDVQQRYALTAHDRILHFSAFNFDTALEQMLPGLLAGAQVLVRSGEIWSPEDFHRKMIELELTIADLPTAYWHHIARAWEAIDDWPDRFPLRLVLIGGERLPADSLPNWSPTQRPDIRLLNAYGPTEATITAALFDIPADWIPTPGASVPIGRPLANRTAYVLDERGQPAPIGVPGELYLGGVNLARGYLNRPDLTAERFVPLPLSETGGDTGGGHRLYKTGDLARRCPDGALEFMGRRDQQVKVRGYRVELGEIEAALKEHPAVKEAAVLARGDSIDDQRLAAYVVWKTETPLEASALRRFLKDKLPDYMLPSTFTSLAALPLDANSKIDRRALLTHEGARPAAESGYVAPQTGIERTLAAIWQDVLHIDRVGVHDSFFELGGHSLLLVKVHAKIREALDRDLPLLDLFRYPTVHTLGRHLRQGEAEPPSLQGDRQRGRARQEAVKRQHAHRRAGRAAKDKERRDSRH